METKPQFDLGPITNSSAQTLFCFPFSCSVCSLLLPVVRSSILLVTYFIELNRKFSCYQPQQGAFQSALVYQEENIKNDCSVENNNNTQTNKKKTIPDKKEPA